MPAISPLALLTTFVLQTVVLSGAGLAAQVWLRRFVKREVSRTEAVVIGVLAPTLLGYVAFWIYFASALAGRYFSFAVVVAVVVTLLPQLAARSIGRVNETFGADSKQGLVTSTATLRQPLVLDARLLALTLAAGLFYLAALSIFPGPKFTDTAGGRFMAKMPGDNEIPRIFAERLYSGASPKRIGGDWLSSDRPPLQTGIALIAMPLLRAARVDIDLICGTAGVWFQLLWIPALWLFLRWLGLKEHEAHAATAALTFSGFLLFHSVFVWPKLGAAALVLIAFFVLFSDEQALGLGAPTTRFGVAAALVALGTLAHGGVMFSLLALIPLAWRRCWKRRAATLVAAAVFFALTLPWTAYQKLYEPPGDRLVKWHIAGQIPPEERGVFTTLRENYRELGWAKAWEARRINFAALFHGEWRGLLTPRAGELALFRRANEASWTFRTLAVWILGLPAIAWLALRAWRVARASRPWTARSAAKSWAGSPCHDQTHGRDARASLAWRGFGRRHALAAGWVALTLLAWVALMFLPRQTLVHQGSLVVQLLMLGLLAGALVLCGRWIFLAVAAAQAWLFLLTWLPPPPPLTWSVHMGAGVLCVVMAIIIAAMVLTAWRSAGVPPASADQAGGTPALLWPRLRDWSRAPRLTWWLLAMIALLLFLRKPDALHTPQLWAEDGSIFLAFNDLLGARAFFEPYMGYLHTLPRLIAWSASHALDPAWWPAFYNGVSFLIWLAVIARMFSPRLDLPGKPWLALAFIIGPQTGEILFNITNLQWITAFLVIQQAMIARPTTIAQRVGDIAILALVGLTGPFIIALGPLLAWRWWRDAALPRTKDHGPETKDLKPNSAGVDLMAVSAKAQRLDASLVLLVAAACAAVQAWFVVRTGPTFGFPPFDAVAFLQNVGQRMLLWPILGETLIRKLPPVVVGIAGIAIVVALMAWALRPHPRRALRVTVIAAFGLMMAAMVYRSRPDTWNYENLVFSDRYYYIPRVLLAWLLVWEFDAVPRAVAWIARGLFIAIAAMHLHTYIVPAPPNYHWPQQVEPIRRGVPAEIPTLPEGWTLEYRGRK